MAEKILSAIDILRKRNGLPLRDATEFEALNRETQARYGKIGHKTFSTVAAYVNHNRWVADCQNCGAGMALQPGVNQVVCMECGERYDVAWPEDRDAIEGLLVTRPRKNRHWYPRETLRDLRRENREHGIGKAPVHGGE